MAGYLVGNVLGVVGVLAQARVDGRVEDAALSRNERMARLHEALVERRPRHLQPWRRGHEHP
eukprot:2916892-Lingulodinium_polyedra.AAC.1